MSAPPLRPLVSVGMPVFNVENTIVDAVESIRIQTFGDWELIIVDDGSTDSTPELLARIRDPRVRVISHRENAGLGQRLNETVAVARGRYFARMDGDDVCYPERLQVQLEYLERNPEVDLVGCWMMLLDDKRQAIGTWEPPQDHAHIAKRTYHSVLMGHPTFFGRHEWFVRNPYPAEFLRTQDQMLLIDAAPRSRFANVQRVLVGYNYPPADIRSALRRRIEFSANAALYFARHRRLLDLVRNIATQSAVAALECASEITGLKHRLLIHRIASLRPDREAEWLKAWRAVSEAVANTREENVA